MVCRPHGSWSSLSRIAPASASASRIPPPSDRVFPASGSQEPSQRGFRFTHQRGKACAVVSAELDVIRIRVVTGGAGFHSRFLA